MADLPLAFKTDVFGGWFLPKGEERYGFREFLGIKVLRFKAFVGKDFRCSIFDSDLETALS